MENKERLAKLESRQKTLEKKQEENRGDIRRLFNRTDENRSRIGAVEKDIEKILDNQGDIQNDIQGISRRVNHAMTSSRLLRDFTVRGSTAGFSTRSAGRSSLDLPS